MIYLIVGGVALVILAVIYGSQWTVASARKQPPADHREDTLGPIEKVWVATGEQLHHAVQLAASTVRGTSVVEDSGAILRLSVKPSIGRLESDRGLFVTVQILPTEHLTAYVLTARPKVGGGTGPIESLTSFERQLRAEIKRGSGLQLA